MFKEWTVGSEGKFSKFYIYNDLEFISNYGVPINIGDCNLVVMQEKLRDRLDFFATKNPVQMYP